MAGEKLTKAEDATLTVEEALRESAYLAGMKAGWNFGVVEDKDGYMRAVQARAGYLKPITERRHAARQALRTRPMTKAAYIPQQPTVILSQGQHAITLTLRDGDAALALDEMLGEFFAENAPYEPITIVLTGGPFSRHTRSFGEAHD